MKNIKVKFFQISGIFSVSIQVTFWVALSFLFQNCKNGGQDMSELLLPLIGFVRPTASNNTTNNGNAPAVTIQYSDSGGTIMNRSYPAPGANINLTSDLTFDPKASLLSKTFSVSPSLPSGLYINSFYGNIFGTPTIGVPNTEYTISLSYTILYNGKTYQGQSTSTKISFSTNYDPSLSYSSLQIGNNILTAGVNVNFPANSNGFGSGTIAYSIFPITLPTGLSFNTSNGSIFGTPTAITAPIDFTVTATNSNATKSISFSLEVKLGSTQSISYPSPNMFVLNVPITSLNPNFVPNFSNQISSWSITPALPSGLSFNNSTGVISGTPTVVSEPAVYYTVTGTNSLGFKQANFNIGVKSVVFGYPDPSTGYTQPIAGLNRFFTSFSPNNPTPQTAGSISSYSITPALPTGLSFNTSNGSISGYAVNASNTIHTVTANSSSGSSTTSVNLNIQDGSNKCYFAGTTDGCTSAFPYSCGVSTSCYSSTLACVNSPECN